MVQIITQNGGGGGGGGGTSYTAGNGIDITNNEISVDESVVQTTDNLVTDLTDPDDTHYPSAKAVSDAITSSGGGDMLKSVYDPNSVEADAFDYNNFTNTPTIPTVNDAILTITQNGTSKGTFTANQSSDVTIALTDTTYTAGTGIDITGTTISNSGVTSVNSSTGDVTVQPTLVSGTNIKTINSTSILGSGDISITDTTYTAGTGLSLVGTEFSADTTVLATQTDLSNKQDTLTAGSNITISSNTISATDTTYTAGTGLSLNGTEFSADTTVLATQTDLSSKQDTLTAGTGISISSNTVSNTGVTSVNGSTGDITNVMKGTDSTSASYTISVVSELPSSPSSSVIYIVTS